MLGAIATYDNETKKIDSCVVNSVEGEIRWSNNELISTLDILGCQQEKENSLLYSDDDVDMSSFQTPKDFDVNKVVEAITTVGFWIS